MSEMINPYIAGAPVTEKTMFFGRQDVFEWVQRSLTGKFVDHILVIHGQRRIGKTSVLKQIPFHLPPTYIPVFFDLQGRTHTTIDRFLWRLAKEITRTLRTAEDISLPELTREEFSEDPELFQNQLLPQISQAIGDRRLLLIFDEFDSLEEPTAREMLTQDLVPYFSRLMHAPGPLAFIFCIGSSGRKLEHMQAFYTESYRIALYSRISFLENEEQQTAEQWLRGEEEMDKGLGDRIKSVLPSFNKKYWPMMGAFVKEISMKLVVDEVVHWTTLLLLR